jgi:hypothetical protein
MDRSKEGMLRIRHQSGIMDVGAKLVKMDCRR